jgi:hypothetical protein
MEALNTLASKDVAEVKAMKTPPAPVRLVLTTAVCILKELKPVRAKDDAGVCACVRVVKTRIRVFAFVPHDVGRGVLLPAQAPAASARAKRMSSGGGATASRFSCRVASLQLCRRY